MKLARWFVCLTAVALSSIALPSIAQVYPVRTVRFVLPYSPGGSYDAVARILAQSLSARLGQPVVIENRPGAATRIGTEILVKSSPDGYSIGMFGNSLTIAPNVYRQVPYDIDRDLASIGMVAIIAQMLVVHPSLPAKSASDLVKLAKSKPGQLHYGSGGTGGMTHLSGELFKSMAGVDLVHVPYKGSAPAMIELITGQVQMMLLNLLNAIPQVKSGKLRGLAVSSLKRSRFVPELPTLDESGLKGYEIVEWYGMAAPARTPQVIIDRLHGEIVKIGNTEDFRSKLAHQSAEVSLSTPAELAAYMKTDLARNAKIVKEAGIRPE
jgi:tripartite-type tricarboxylate transporter receptor subunit TctC